MVEREDRTHIEQHEDTYIVYEDTYIVYEDAYSSMDTYSSM